MSYSSRPVGSSSRVSADSPGCELRDRLRGERVEPGQPVLARDGEHRAVGQVDDGLTGCKPLLLAERVAVVLRRGADGARE